MEKRGSREGGKEFVEMKHLFSLLYSTTFGKDKKGDHSKTKGNNI
jgi:hypothetical protein